MPSITDRLKSAYAALRGVELKASSSAWNDVGWGATDATSVRAVKLPGSWLNWAHRAGEPWKCSAVTLPLNWFCTSHAQAPVCVMRKSTKGKDEQVEQHPFTDLLKRPNPVYSGRALWYGTNLSLLCDGNAYWLKQRNRGEQTAELWYVPHWMITPKIVTDDGPVRMEYEYRIRGKTVILSSEQIVHHRYGIDPERPACGLGPIRAVLREIATDNEATTYTAAIMTNMGIVPYVIGPADESLPIDKDDADTLKTTIRTKTTGDKRGEWLILAKPYKLDKIGFSPEEMALDKIRQWPEARICGAIQIPAQVCGLNVGNEMKTYANYAEARRSAWEDGIMPVQDLQASTLDDQLLQELGGTEGEYVAWDYSRVRALQDDEDAKHKRIVVDYQGGVIKRSEARLAIDLEADAADEVYINDLQAAQAQALAELKVNQPQADPNAEKAKAAERWRLRL